MTPIAPCRSSSEALTYFLNKLSGFAFYLSKADEKSVIGAPELDVVREKWTIEENDGGGVLIKSEKNGLYVGFNGVPRHGAEIITVSRQDAKVWNIKSSDEEYQVILRDDVSWLIEFDKEKMYTGMRAHLVRAISGANQFWTIAMPT